MRAGENPFLLAILIVVVVVVVSSADVVAIIVVMIVRNTKQTRHFVASTCVWNSLRKCLGKNLLNRMLQLGELCVDYAQ